MNAQRVLIVLGVAAGQIHHDRNLQLLRHVQGDDVALIQLVHRQPVAVQRVANPSVGPGLVHDDPGAMALDRNLETPTIDHAVPAAAMIHAHLDVAQVIPLAEALDNIHATVAEVGVAIHNHGLYPAVFPELFRGEVQGIEGAEALAGVVAGVVETRCQRPDERCQSSRRPFGRGKIITHGRADGAVILLGFVAEAISLVAGDQFLHMIPVVGQCQPVAADGMDERALELEGRVRSDPASNEPRLEWGF